jgi:hypothetical protein
VLEAADSCFARSGPRDGPGGERDVGEARLPVRASCQGEVVPVESTPIGAGPGAGRSYVSGIDGCCDYAAHYRNIAEPKSKKIIDALPKINEGPTKINRVTRLR